MVIGYYVSAAVIFLIAAAFFVFLWRLAKRRGYNPWCWIFSGLIGLIVLLCMPSPKTAATPEQTALRAKRGNITGVVITTALLLINILHHFLHPHPIH
ncbi:MAG: hypothetical protein C5B53_10725 [Candidatus Melainabacteria bacterium]|nr:MAG: hypothetical protein C5B53_10725 [Candidatus Melainabacteria bacterium]